MSQANVYTSVSNAVWYTDKCDIVTGNTPVNYNVYVVEAGPATVGLTGTVSNGNNVMLTASASQRMVNATFVSGTGVANTVTVTGAVNGTSLTLSANATATSTGPYTMTLGSPGNLYSAAPQVAANWRQTIYVGAGNYLTITGTGFTARETGTASSATAGF
jgi:hypothetical protein